MSFFCFSIRKTPFDNQRAGFDSGRLSVTVTALIILALAGSWQGRPAFAGDDLLDGFDDPAPASGQDLLDGFGDQNTTRDDFVRQNRPVPPPLAFGALDAQQAIHLGGHIKTAAAYNFSHDAPVRGRTNWQGVSSLKTELLLELDIKSRSAGLDWSVFASGLAAYDAVYRARGRDNYTDEVLDAYETRTQIRELYLQASPLKHLDIKTGRQIVVWGTSDYVRVVDILNPLDLRDPGTTDIEDLRLPVTMSKIDCYLGSFSLSGILVHEVRFNDTPPLGSAFHPSFRAMPQEEVPDCDLENTQFAMALKGIFSGWDFGLYWADIYNPVSHNETVSNGRSLSLVQKHERVNMFGASSSLARGNWLFKAEAACWDGLKYTNVSDLSFLRLDIMAGGEYSGFTNTRITLELVNQHIFGYRGELENAPDRVDEDLFQWVICMQKDFMNETLTLTVLAAAYEEKMQGGSYQRISAEYDIADSLSVKAGVVFYQSGDQPLFSDAGGNDKIFMELKYSF